MTISGNNVEKIARFYDEIEKGIGYDENYSAPICRAEDQILAEKILPLITDKVILDIGCGTGLVAQNYPVYRKYYGMDVSQKELEKAHKKISNPSCNFIRADMSRLPFPSNYFDSVVSTYGPFSYSLEPSSLLSEIIRVVKPDGDLAIMPYSRRTGLNIDLGSYSTASEDSIEKIFYTQELASSVFERIKNKQVTGINFLVNYIVEENNLLNKLSRGEFSREDFEDIFIKYCQHFSEISCDLTSPSNSEKIRLFIRDWNQIMKDKSPHVIKTEPDILKNLMLVEQQYLTSIFPAHIARHMLITGKKN